MAEFVVLNAGGLAFPIAVDVDAPTIPQLDTTYELPGGDQHSPADSSELTSLLSGGTLDGKVLKRGDVIVLDSATTYSGAFIFPVAASLSGSGWIYVISSALSSLPAGTRVAPADVTYMPLLEVTSDIRSVYLAEGCQQWRFAGIEFSATNTSNTTLWRDLIRIGDATYPYDEPASVSDLATDIVFDRCYIHCTATGAYEYGIHAAGCKRLGVVDCYISDIHMKSNDGGYCIRLISGPGPHKIENNYLSCSGSSVHIGSSLTDWSGSTFDTAFNATDVSVLRNRFFKSLTWKVDDPSYAGIDWVIKNHLEFKGGSGAWVEGNEFENCWSDATGGQAGYTLLITPRLCDFSGMTFRRNFVHGTARCVQLSGTQQGWSVSDVLFEDNVWTGMTSHSIDFNSLASPETVTNITFNHNTFVSDSQQGDFILAEKDGNYYPYLGLTLTNNIWEHAQYGIVGAGTADGTATLNQYCISYSVDTNVVIGRTGMYTETATFKNFSYETTSSNVGFVNASPVALADFALDVTSDYYQAALDGEDYGADVSAVLAGTRISA